MNSKMVLQTLLNIFFLIQYNVIKVMFIIQLKHAITIGFSQNNRSTRSSEPSKNANKYNNMIYKSKGNKKNFRSQFTSGGHYQDKLFVIVLSDKMFPSRY